MAKKLRNKDYMELALELAGRGFGSVEPNPIVGCVIVKDGQIIGQGWHKIFGAPHAEINALDDCKKNGFDPAGATMIVTLEPCCHHGKTGPCTDTIIAAGIKKVIAAMTDPTDKVGGKGIEQLQKAGIEVKTGICEKQARLLNPAFIKFAKTNTPWVVLKWAQTIDGKLALKDSKPHENYISGEEARKDVHKIRRSAQAILVGVNTVISDDPLLTARPDKGKELLRIVLDGNLRIPLESQLLHTTNEGKVLIVAGKDAIKKNPDKAKEIENLGAEIFTAPQEEAGRCDLKYLLNELGKRNIQKLLVEGGPDVLKSFLSQHLADELIVYIAPKIFAANGKADMSKVFSEMDCSIELHQTSVGVFGEDVKIRGLLRKMEEI